MGDDINMKHKTKKPTNTELIDTDFDTMDSLNLGVK